MPATKFVVNLENEDFRCYVNEDVKPDTLSLAKTFFSTLDGGYCSEDKLAASSTFTGGLISFRIHHIVKEGDCNNPQFNPSRNLISGYLEEGEYPVSLSLSQSLHYKGTFTVSPDLYRLEFESAPNIFVHPKITYRIPQGAIWFRIYHLEQRTAIAEECLSEIRKFGKSDSFNDGYYSYFLQENGEIQLTSENKYPHLQSIDEALILENPDTNKLDSLFGIFDSFAERAGHQFYVDLRTWKNQTHTIE